MKHPVKATTIIVLMFLVSQLIGLAVITSYDHFFGKTHENIVKQAQEQNITLPEQPNVSISKELPPPPVEAKAPAEILQIVVSILIAIAIASALFFLLMKIGVVPVLKGWFAIVIFICLSLALSLILYPFIGLNLVTIAGIKFSLAEVIAVPLAIVLTFFKIFKRNLFVHNLTELFIYPGFAILFLPMLNLVIVSFLLIAISIYDIVAVWRSNYMVNLAKFQMEHLKVFTGFFVPYLRKKDRVKVQEARALAKRIKKSKNKMLEKKLKKMNIRVNVAALGGGDVAFPLIFLGVIFLVYGFAAYFISLACIVLSLILLLLFTQKGKAYPAMPFLTAGCFLGLFIVLLAGL